MTSAEAPKRWDFDEPQICAKCGVVDLLTGGEFPRKNLCHYCNGRDDKENKYISLTIDEVPECIRQLSFVEEMLISLELPLMYLCTLTAGGQVGYRAHTTVVEQNIQSVASRLPRALSDVGASLCTVRQTRRRGECVDFKVRSDVVLKALRWLKKNNPLYKHVEIAQDAVDVLDKDGYFYGQEFDEEVAQDAEARAGIDAGGHGVPAPSNGGIDQACAAARSTTGKASKGAQKNANELQRPQQAHPLPTLQEMGLVSVENDGDGDCFFFVTGLRPRKTPLE